MYCDRCKSYSNGQSSICFDKYSSRYEIISGYESDFDMMKIYLTGDFKTENELRERFPWITNIGKEFDNLCNDCVRNMIKDKEARSEDIEHFFAPFYTACCDRYISEIKEEDFHNFFVVSKQNKSPYISYYLIVSWEDEYKYAMQDFQGESYLIPQGKEFFNYYPNCTICKNCFTPNFSKREAFHIEDHPVLHSLGYLKASMEQFLDFHLRDGKSIITRSSCKYSESEYQEYFLERFYWYQSRKNMLDLKRELRFFVLNRNLNIIKEYISIPKDICNLILK
jgi:hypothetical protein